jgi:hypothetical protein
VTLADNGSVLGSTVDLKRITSVSDISSVTVGADTGANVVQLSTTLINSGVVNIDFGNSGAVNGGDAAADRLIFQMDNLNYQSTGTIASFNTITNLDFVGTASSATALQDRVGFFAGSGTGTSFIPSGAYTTLSASGGNFALVDGKFFEDSLGFLNVSGDVAANDIAAVRSYIAQTITNGGGSANIANTVAGAGVQFIWAVSGYSTGADNSVDPDNTNTSLFLYSGQYTGLAVAGGGTVQSSDIQLVALAEVVGYEDGSFAVVGNTSSSFTLTKPGGLT